MPIVVALRVQEHDATPPAFHSGNESSLLDAPFKGGGRKGAGEVNAGGGEVEMSPSAGGKAPAAQQ